MNRRDFAKMLLSYGGSVLAASAMIANPSVSHAAEMDRTIAFYAHSSTDRGMRFLRTQQASDGTWGGDIGNTARALRSFLTSYRRYTPLDGPFMSKPVSWLANALATTSEAELAEIPSADLADAITTLRGLKLADGAVLVEQLQGSLALRLPNAGAKDTVALQYEMYRALTSLAGNQTPAVGVYRSSANGILMGLQLASDGFPGADGAESLSMTYASAVSFGLARQSESTQQARAALDRAVETYATSAAPSEAGEPVFLLYEALQSAMTRAERGVDDGRLGQAETWRDTMTYALLEIQGDDGGWLPGGTEADRVAATARAVNAINKALPAR